MNTRTTLFLGLIAAGLAAYIYFFGLDAPGTGERAERARKLLLIDPDEVDRVRVTEGEERFVMFKSEDRGWMLEKPIEYRADPVTIQTVLSELEFSSRLATLARADFEDLEVAMEQMGLTTPTRGLAVWQDGDSRQIDFGVATPRAGTIYARVRAGGRDEIVVVDEGLVARIEGGLGHWRSKTVFDFQSPQVVRIVLREEERQIEVALIDDNWQIDRPFSSPAEREAVITYLSQLLTMKVADFVSDDGGAGYGLDSPATVLEVEMASGEKTVLRLGREVEGGEGARYAQIADSPTVFTLAPQSLARIAGLASKTRERRIVSFRSVDEVTSLTLAGKNFDIQLVRQESPRGWRFAGGDRRAESVVVDEFLRNLIGARAEDFLPIDDEGLSRTGLKEPAVQIHYETAARKGQVALGVDANNQVSARTPAVPFLMAISPDSLLLIPEQPVNWYERHLVVASREQIRRGVWKKGEAVFRLEAGTDGKWPEQFDGQAVDGAILDRQWSLLGRLPIQAWYVLKEGEFARPDFVMEVELVDGTVKQLEFMEDTRGETVHGRVAGEAEGFIISIDDYILLTTLPILAGEDVSTRTESPPSGE